MAIWPTRGPASRYGLGVELSILLPISHRARSQEGGETLTWNGINPVCIRARVRLVACRSRG